MNTVRYKGVSVVEKASSTYCVYLIIERDRSTREKGKSWRCNTHWRVRSTACRPRAGTCVSRPGRGLTGRRPASCGGNSGRFTSEGTDGSLEILELTCHTMASSSGS